jgi:cell division septum initiation protein DivIVA
MAPDISKPASDDAVEMAIMRVLDAEAAAREAIARARVLSAEIAEKARQTARSLRLVADRRLERVRAAFDARCTTEVAALEAQAAALAATHDPTSAEVAEIELAVAALARTLTEGIP